VMPQTSSAERGIERDGAAARGPLSTRSIAPSNNVTVLRRRRIADLRPRGAGPSESEKGHHDLAGLPHSIDAASVSGEMSVND
jgi:hypothetical protein